jgi:hypothetical protein
MNIWKVKEPPDLPSGSLELSFSLDALGTRLRTNHLRLINVSL